MAKVQYQCDRCLVDCKTKTGLDRHKTQRKKPCEPVAARLDEVKAVAAVAGKVSAEMFAIRNTLRGAGVTGLAAVDCVTAVLLLRELEICFGADELTDESKFDMLGGGLMLARKALKDKETLFSVIAALPKVPPYPISFVSKIHTAFDTLKRHKGEIGKMATQFEVAGKLFPMSTKGTGGDVAYNLIQTCKTKLKFGSADVLGESFSSVIKDLADGKELGQFFTKESIVRYGIKAVSDSRPLGSVLDPTCGSGGFLANVSGADMIAGYEIDGQVMTLAYANCLLAHKKVPNIERCDFLRQAPATQYDTILANPPFGVKGLKHKDLIEALDAGDSAEEGEGKASFPLDSTATGFFLQRIIRVLKVGGRAAVVLPLGKELTSAAPKEKKLRLLILKSCNISEIVTIPSGMFDNTTIRTVLIVFDKVREMSECIISKGMKRITTEVDSKLDHATTEIKFLAMQDDGTVVEPTDIKTPVSIDGIVERGFSLSPDDYKIRAESAQFMGLSEVVPMVRLGDICELKTGKSITRAALKPGPYPVVGGGQSPMGMHSISNTEANAIVVSATGSCGFISRYPTKIFRSGDALEVKVFDVAVSDDYVFHVLKSEMSTIQQFRTGMAQPHLDKAKFLDMPIPLPPTELQKIIAHELNELASGIENAKKTAEHWVRKMRISLQCAIHSRDVTIAALGDICKINAGVYITKTDNTVGEYPVYGGGGVAFHTNKFNRENKTVIAKDGVSECCVRFVSGKFFLNHHGWTLTILKPDQILEGFLSHVLEYLQPQIYQLASGAAQKGINQAKMLKLEIPLPSLDVQKLVADELDKMATTLAALRRDEEHTRGLMREKLRMMLSPVSAPSDVVDDRPSEFSFSDEDIE